MLTSPSNTTTTTKRRPLKRKKSQPPSTTLPHSNPNTTESRTKTEPHEQWRSVKQQQIYSSKLIHALTHLNLPAAATSPSAPHRGRSVRQAADRALAASAKGRTRWSRAILAGRITLKFRKLHNRRRRALAPPPSTCGKARVRLKGKGSQSVQRKVKVLGRLVPGCRKETVAVILEEATDYIAALEMQVRSLTALTNLLSGSSSASSTPAATS